MDVQHLPSDAGLGFTPTGSREKPAPVPLSDGQIEAALAEHAGKVRGTARALGMHRNQLRRWIERRDAGTAGEGRLEDEL